MDPPASCLEYRIPASGKWAVPSSIILIACERGEAPLFGQSATQTGRNEAVDENDRLQTRLGAKIMGFVDHRFDGTGITIALTRAPGMVDFDISDFPQAYS